MTKTLQLEAPDGTTLPVFDVKPPTGARGAVLVLQEAFGVNAHIEDVCRRFAAEGYRTVAPHLFHRSGDPIIDYSRIEDVFPHFAALSAAGLSADVDATVGLLNAEGFAHDAIATVGFCMGGTIAFLTAVERPLGAAVTLYGSGIREGRFGYPPLIDLAPQLEAPWLGLFGDRDRSIPSEDVEGLRRAAAQAAVPTEVVRYPDAEHGFFCDARPAYEPVSAADAWRRTLTWLEDHLRPRP